MMIWGEPQDNPRLPSMEMQGPAFGPESACQYQYMGLKLRMRLTLPGGGGQIHAHTSRDVGS